jgi:prophage maintenance system killer protein
VQQYRYLGLVDFLAIAEANTDFERRDLADNDEVITRALNGLWAPTSDAFADLVAKAAALEFALIRNRPLPAENVLVAHECMKEFARRNGFTFEADQSEVDVNDLFEVIIAGADEALARLTIWLRETLLPS